jgi:hypothetical protein
VHNYKSAMPTRSGLRALLQCLSLLLHSAGGIVEHTKERMAAWKDSRASVSIVQAAGCTSRKPDHFVSCVPRLHTFRPSGHWQCSAGAPRTAATTAAVAVLMLPQPPTKIHPNLLYLYIKSHNDNHSCSKSWKPTVVVRCTVKCATAAQHQFQQPPGLQPLERWYTCHGVLHAAVWRYG